MGGGCGSDWTPAIRGDTVNTEVMRGVGASDYSHAYTIVL